MSKADAPSDDAASQNAAQENSSGGKEGVLMRLEKDDPTLTSLRVMKHHGKAKDGPYFRPRTEEDWTRLGDAIATNKNLQRLDIIDFRYNVDVPDTPCARLYSKMNENRTIRRLVLSNVDTYDGGGIVYDNLARFLEENSCLSSLAITRCYLRAGEHNVWPVLSGLGGSLKYLDLSYTSIDGDGIEGLAPHISSLRSLELNGNLISCEVCVRIADTIFTNPQPALVRLYLDENRIRDTGATALAEGLAHMAHSGRLKTLSLGRNWSITSAGYEAFLRTVCNSPGIDDIMNSNHALQRLEGDPPKMPKELTHYLHLNKTRNKSHVAGQKVALHHFVYNCNIELFEGIPGCLVPNILAMMGEHETRPSDKNERTDADAARHNELVRYDYQTRFRGLHRIVRRCPWICGRTVDTAKASGGSAAAESAAKKARLS